MIAKNPVLSQEHVGNPHTRKVPSPKNNNKHEQMTYSRKKTHTSKTAQSTSFLLLTPTTNASFSTADTYHKRKLFAADTYATLHDQTNKRASTQTNQQTNNQTNKHTHTRTYTHTHTYIHIRTNKQTNKQTKNKHSHREREREIYIYIYIYKPASTQTKTQIKPLNP